ncbi:MAG: hypothetical protein JXR73_00930 [Candidatus Omnitrophica bacterium]|nr:hypothetical protein [Candidatus Omnitrophota bacterium]
MPRGDVTKPSTNNGGGRMGGPRSAGPDGQCICPKCGFKAPHTQGQSCNQKKYPQCGERHDAGMTKV